MAGIPYWRSGQIDDLIEERHRISKLVTTRQLAARLDLTTQHAGKIMADLGIRPEYDGIPGARGMHALAAYWDPVDVERAVAVYTAWKASKLVPWRLWIAPPDVTEIAAEACPPSKRGKPRPTIKINDSTARVHEAVERVKSEAANAVDRAKESKP